MLYHIVTQNKNRSDIITLLCRHFGGFTLIRATGVYTDKVGTHIEPALVIEIDDIGDKNRSPRPFAYAIRTIVEAIKEMNQQDCVLLQKITSESELI